MATTPQGTGFTNLSQYQQANNGTALGNNLAQNISNTTNNANTDLTNQTNNFNTQAQANNYNTSANQDYVQNIINDPSKVGTNDINNFANYRAGGYNGPTGLSNTSQLNNESNLLGSYGNSVNSQTGRYGLLTNMLGGGNNNYTSGQQNLDSYLIGNNQNLTTAGKQAGQEANAIKKGIQSAENTAGNIQQGNKQFGNYVNNVLGLDSNGNLQNAQDTNGNYTSSGAIQNQVNAVNANVLQDQANAALYPDIEAKLAATPNGTTLTPQEMALVNSVGLTQGTNVYNANPNQYLTANPVAANLNNVATQNQATNIANLAALAGLANIWTPNSAQAGTYTGPIAYNAAPIQQAAQNYVNAQNASAQSLMGPNGVLSSYATNSPDFKSDANYLPNDTIQQLINAEQNNINSYNQGYTTGNNLSQDQQFLAADQGALAALANAYGANTQFGVNPNQVKTVMR